MPLLPGIMSVSDVGAPKKTSQHNVISQMKRFRLNDRQQQLSIKIAHSGSSALLPLMCIDFG